MTSKQGRIVILALLLLTLGATQAFGQKIYDNIPNPLPGNLPSVGFEANQANQFGDRVQFAGTSRTLTTVVQGMSSWGCQKGHWNTANCVTTPGATFLHPIKLNIYNVAAGNQVGSLIASVTQTFAIPFRPSASINCVGTDAGKWYQASSATCFNGYATTITFNLTGLGIVVPNQVIFGIEYNTTHYGNPAIGESAPCYTSLGGCGYDSLNVLTTADPPTVGVNPAPSDAYFSTLTAANYCDGGAGGVGTFRLDAGPTCWTGFKPTIRFNAANPALTKDDCKNGGWQTHTTATGAPFKNQGQCIEYVEDLKDNDDKDKKDKDGKKDKDDKGDKHDH